MYKQIFIADLEIMNIQEYYEKLNDSCQKIFQDTLSDLENFGKVHYFSNCLFDFAEILNDKKESDLLKVVCSQIETSALHTSFGLYRQAFSSLRLSLEMGLGMVYFSAFKLDHYEWLNGKNDIKWSKIIDKESGVLSKRFAEAFFSELVDLVEENNTQAATVYRRLSEFVHGNFETWEENNLTLAKNELLIEKYFEYFVIVKEILLFALCCRFLKSLTIDNIDSIPFVLEEMGHCEGIRVFMGGQKGL
jgi:sensor histidine kinase YesM